jgi:hypothetical protein
MMALSLHTVFSLAFLNILEFLLRARHLLSDGQYWHQ